MKKMKMSFYPRIVNLFLLGLIIIVGITLLLSCRRGGRTIPVWRDPAGTIEIVNIHFNSTDDLQNTAEKLRQQLESENKDWDIIALTDAGEDGALLFDTYMHGTTSAVDLYDSHVSASFIANPNKFEIIGSIEKWIGEVDPHKFYWAIGARFKNKKTGKIIPIIVYRSVIDQDFYNANYQYQYYNEERKILYEIEDRFANYDLTPIVVGYPLGKGERLIDEYNQIRGIRWEFNEATMVLNYNSSSQGIWIGKESSFPETEGTMMFKEHWRWNLDGTPVTYAKMKPTYWEFQKKFDTPPKARSNSRPILFSIYKTLYIVWNGRNQNGDFVILKTNNQPPREFDVADRLYVLRNDTQARIGSNYSPSMAYFKKKRYIVWFTRGKGELRIRSQSSQDGHIRSEIWDSRITFTHTSDASPSMIATDDKLFIAWKEAGTKKIYIMDSSDGINWSTARDVGIRTSSGPSLEYFKGKLFISWIGDNKKHVLIQSSSNNGSTWGNKKKLLDTNSNYAPFLYTLTNEERPNMIDVLYLTYTGFNGQMQVKCSKDGIDWSEANRAIDQSANTPSLIYHDYRFILGWPGTEADRYLNIKSSQMLDEVAIDFYR
jgi:hypothetical protein